MLLLLLEEHGAEAWEHYNKAMRFPLAPSRTVCHNSLSFKVLILVFQSSAVLLRAYWYHKLHDVTSHKTDTFINTAVWTWDLACFSPSCNALASIVPSPVLSARSLKNGTGDGCALWEETHSHELFLFTLFPYQNKQDWNLEQEDDWTQSCKSKFPCLFTYKNLLPYLFYVINTQYTEFGRWPSQRNKTH